MRILLALAFVAAACSGPTKKPEGAIVNEGSATPDTCCCKSTPLTSADGKPVYETIGRMECSTKEGDCVDEVQCNQPEQPPAE